MNDDKRRSNTDFILFGQLTVIQATPGFTKNFHFLNIFMAMKAEWVLIEAEQRICRMYLTGGFMGIYMQRYLQRAEYRWQRGEWLL